MVGAGLDSNLWVARKDTHDPRVHEHGGTRFLLASETDRRLWRLQRSPTTTWRSPARFGSLSAREINASDADVVNLHWVTDGFLSIEQIGRITKPVVWSMYDMWPFAGTEHYGTDTADARWRSGYTRDNRPPSEGGFDLDRKSYERKRRHWRPMHMVPASRWLEQATRASALMGNWPITRIPHIIDTALMEPWNKEAARARLGLPASAPLILFLASAGVLDQRKGWDLLERALPEVRRAIPDLEVVIVGPRDAHYTSPSGTRLHWYGTASTSEELRSLYCAADVTAVPSREDNMPLTAMEAQSCGRPVVAFSIGGLPDIVEHEVTGFLAPMGDVDALAGGLIQAIRDGHGEQHWGAAARQRSLDTWSPQAVVPQYLDVYAQVQR